MSDIVTITAEGNRGVLRIQRGEVTAQGKFGGSRAVKTAAKALGVDPNWLQSIIDQGPGVYRSAPKPTYKGCNTSDIVTITAEGKRGVLRIRRGDMIERGQFGGSHAVKTSAKALGVDPNWLQSIIDQGPGVYRGVRAHKGCNMSDIVTITAEGNHGVLRIQRGTVIERGKFGGSRAVKTSAKALGVDPNWLQSIIDQGPGEYEVPAPPAAPAAAPVDVSVWVRGLRQADDEAARLRYPTLTAALADASLTIPEPLIQWDRKMEALCALDVDFHDMPMDARPNDAALQRLIDRAKPTPALAWITHGRGLRLVYYARESFLAHELAAVAACRVKALEPRAACELKSSTRHPGYPNAAGRRCGEVQILSRPDADVSAVLGWCEGRGNVDPQQVEQYLEDHYDGLESIGRRYTHDKCPVDSGHVTTNSTPVCVYEDGIYCYSCMGRGIRRGAKAAGWFPFEVLLGTPCASQLSVCVDNMTHWEHARHVLAGLHALDEAILRGAYGALLRHRHGDDPRVSTVFAAGQDVVRYTNRWGTLRGQTYGSSHLDAILAKLPACQFVGADRVVRPDPERIARFMQAVDLSRLGYPELRTVWGSRIGSHWVQTRYPYEIVIPNKAGRPPRYVRASERRIEDAWARIASAFPGVVRPAIELLIAAKGCVERDGTWPPFVFISGATGSAKSTSVILAAAIAGDTVSEVPLICDDEKLRAAIRGAKETGTYCVFNEAVKSQNKRKVAKDEAMEFALTLTKASVSHQLYVGPVPLGTLPVCVWTDVDVPYGMKTNAQVARRFVWIELPDAVPDWHARMIATGIQAAEDLRQAADTRYADAADVILSDVIDRFFEQPRTFGQIAQELGFPTLDSCAEAKEQDADLQRFFELVQADTRPRATYGGVDGYVVIDPRGGTSHAVDEWWFNMADPPERMASQRLKERDWTQVLKAPWRVKLDIKRRHSKVLVKFLGVQDVAQLGYKNA